MSSQKRKTLEEYEIEEEIRLATEKERSISDDKYAAKIVERILFGFLSVTALGVIGYIGNLILEIIKSAH